MSNNIFLNAALRKYRFPTGKGELSVERLAELPLEGADSLDTTAQTLDTQIQQSQKKSFVRESSSASTELRQKLQIVIEIIEYKKALEEKRAARAVAAADKELLLEIKQQRRIDKMKGMSDEELEAKLNAAKG